MALDAKDFVPLIDVSHHQGDIDFRVMKKAGVPYVLLRAGVGRTEDSRFDTYVANAVAAKMVFGPYWFVDPRSLATGRQQAERYAEVTQPHRERFKLPYMVDIEVYWKKSEAGDANLVKGQALLTYLEDLLERLEDLVGERPILYSNSSVWNALQLPATDLVLRYDWILARYPAFRVDPVTQQAIAYTAEQQAGLVDPLAWPAWPPLLNREPQGPPKVTKWAGWQFAADGDRAGNRFGCTSADLDLNIIRKDAMARWLGVHSSAKLKSIAGRLGLTRAELAQQLQLTIEDREDADMPIFIRGDASGTAGQQTFPFRGNGGAIWERVGPSIYVHVDGTEAGNEAALLNQVDLLTPLVVSQAALDGIPDQFRFTRQSYLDLLKRLP